MNKYYLSGVHELYFKPNIRLICAKINEIMPLKKFFTKLKFNMAKQEKIIINNGTEK
jgi:hypothetical protein